jgi:hypothetical protein
LWNRRDVLPPNGIKHSRRLHNFFFFCGSQVVWLFCCGTCTWRYSKRERASGMHWMERLWSRIGTSVDLELGS